MEGFTTKRGANAAYLNVHIHSVITPQVKGCYDHVWHQYMFSIDHGRDRDDVVKQLNEAGIGTGVFYPGPAHQQGYLRELVGETCRRWPNS